MFILIGWDRSREDMTLPCSGFQKSSIFPCPFLLHQASGSTQIWGYMASSWWIILKFPNLELWSMIYAHNWRAWWQTCSVFIRCGPTWVKVMSNYISGLANGSYTVCPSIMLFAENQTDILHTSILAAITSGWCCNVLDWIHCRKLGITYCHHKQWCEMGKSSWIYASGHCLTCQYNIASG